MLGYLGLGLLGAGAATTALRRNSGLNLSTPLAAGTGDKRPEVAIAPNGGASTDSSTALPMQMKLPDFQGISQWLNSDPLTVAELKGSVVLIQFWTFACINCKRTLPYITQWHQQYADQGLRVIGIHTPEFAFERQVNNIKAALTEHGITYPVPLDNDFATWKAYKNRYWPHLFLSDRDGIIRYDYIGEGAYSETESVIRQLLA
ncbi:MAG TPA: thioredoxin family protein [Chroococcidiopsis sp.]